MVVDPVVALVEAQGRAAMIRPAVGGFPYLAETLRQAGIEHHRYVVPAALGVYWSAEATIVQQDAPVVRGTARLEPWDPAAVTAALRADQDGRTTFPEFARACQDAGVMQFDVDLAARTCTYRGAGPDDVLVERYAAVEVPAVEVPAVGR